MRYVIISACSAYLGAGLFGGIVMGKAIPALNPFGVGVYAVAWPAMVYCAPDNCDPVGALPMWFKKQMFTFT